MTLRKSLLPDVGAPPSPDDASIISTREATRSPCVSPDKFDVLADADSDAHPPAPRVLRSRAHRSRVGSSSRPNSYSDA